MKTPKSYFSLLLLTSSAVKAQDYDEQRNDTVGIALGAALGGILLLCVGYEAIKCLLKRRRAQQSIQEIPLSLPPTPTTEQQTSVLPRLSVFAQPQQASSSKQDQHTALTVAEPSSRHPSVTLSLQKG